MNDELRIEHRSVDHPGSVTCRHCGGHIALPKTEPWVLINGVPKAPAELESLLCPHCRTRVYLVPVTDEKRARDAELDALEDDES